VTPAKLRDRGDADGKDRTGAGVEVFASNLPDAEPMPANTPRDEPAGELHNPAPRELN